MARKNRRILFLILAIIFLISAPTVFLYSLGYRFDIENKKITQSGGFYFKVWPKSSEVYLNGKFVKKTDFFFGALYINNLLPKKYEVEIKKEGYHSWKKTLEVKEKQVTEMKNIFLFPENPKFSIISQDVEDFFVSPDQRKIILKETEIGKDHIFSLKLFELDKNIKSHLAKDTDLGTSSVSEFVNYFFKIENGESFLENESLKNNSLNEQISPDKKKIVYLNNNSEIWITLVKKNNNNKLSREEPEEKILVGRFSEKVNQVFWLNDYYLIFSIGDKIKIAEIYNQDKVSIINFAEFKNPKIFFNQKDKKLYVLEEGKLYVSEALLP